MDPNIIMAGLGVISSVFGGKPSQPKYLADNLKLQNDLMRRATSLYDNTNLQQQDQQTLAQYSEAAMRQAMATLGNNEARFAGAGSPHAKADTQKDRQQAQVASDAGNQVAQLGAQLSSTRPQRMASLLPNPAQAAAGTQAAAYLDQSEALRHQQETMGLMDMAKLVAGLVKRPSGAATSSDAYPMIGTGGVIAPHEAAASIAKLMAGGFAR